MKFDKKNIVSWINADKDYTWWEGYFANSLDNMERAVELEDSEHYGIVHDVEPDMEWAFRKDDVDCSYYRYFYPTKKPEDMPKKYRPYANLDEMHDDRMPRHIYGGMTNKEKVWDMMSNGRFLLKIRDSESYVKIQSVEFDSDTVDLGCGMRTMKELFEDCEWADGKVCGKEEEGK